MKLILALAASAALSIGVGFAGGMYLIKNEGAQAAVPGEETPSQVEADPVVVDLGRMMVPIYRARHVTYVLAEIKVSMPDEAGAEAVAENYDLLRARALETMVDFASTGRFNGETLDQAALGGAMAENMDKALDGHDVGDVLFGSLLRQDVGR